MLLGFDISLNHGAIICLNKKGRLINYWYVSDVKAIANKSKEHGYYLGPKANKEQWNMKRLDRWIEILNDIKGIVKPSITSYASFEDYAYSAAQGAHQLGEIVGITKKIFWDSGIKMRLHDPMTIKMFAVHNGSAGKDFMVSGVNERWKETRLFQDYTHLKNNTITEDLCDAFSVAKLLWTEIQIREGMISLSSLHEKEIRVFNRCTKKHPINVLDRDWICKVNIKEENETRIQNVVYPLRRDEDGDNGN